MNDTWREADGQGLPKYDLPQQHSAFARFHRQDNPLHVIAYKQD